MRLRATEKGDSVDPTLKLKQEIEDLIGISESDSEMFWSLSKKCATLALAPTIAAGATWGPGLIATGSLTLPGLGTVSGATATVLLMGGVWGSSYGACMSLLPVLTRFRDELRANPSARFAVQQDVRRIAAIARGASPRS
jgi:hypothetical protein